MGLHIVSAPVCEKGGICSDLYLPYHFLIQTCRELLNDRKVSLLFFTNILIPIQLQVFFHCTVGLSFLCRVLFSHMTKDIKITTRLLPLNPCCALSNLSPRAHSALANELPELSELSLFPSSTHARRNLLPVS